MMTLKTALPIACGAALLAGLVACTTEPASDSGSGSSGISAETNQDEGTTVTTDDGTGSSTSSTSSDATSGSQPPGSSTAEEDPVPPVIFDVNDPTGGVGGCGGAAPDLTLTGTVWAPNGVIPVSGALVYTSADVPDGIPDGVFCAECSELGCDDRFTLTEADGSFTLQTVSQDANYLVVQKGQFLKFTPVNFGVGMDVVDDELSTLPGEYDPDNGLFIPRIAVGNGSFDRLEDGLGKFGLGDTIIEGFEERLVPGTEPFELWDNGRSPGTDGFTSQGTFAELVADPERLDDYQIIFAPCSGDAYISALTPENIQNIRDWVAAGGRWYVSDWANEWFIRVFPEYQELECDAGGNCDNGAYDSLADVMDDGLLEWLEALPDPLKDINPLNDEAHPTLFELPQVQTVDNWSGITQINQVLVDDGKGGQVDVGHKVWLQGPGGLPAGVHPLTVTGQFGCGKIQFTSYHMAEFFNYVGLSPQELVLLYTILEIGVCQADLPPPEG